MLLERIILTGFGYDKFDDIDIVYPKYTQSQDNIQKLMESLFVTPIKDAEKMVKVNTINSLFTSQVDTEDTIEEIERRT